MKNKLKSAQEYVLEKCGNLELPTIARKFFSDGMGDVWLKLIALRLRPSSFMLCRDGSLTLVDETLYDLDNYVQFAIAKLLGWEENE